MSAHISVWIEAEYMNSGITLQALQQCSEITAH